jgi:predicted nucleic acid-binding protein
VKVYVETNILVAAAVETHPHYFQSFELLSRVKAGEFPAFVSAHGLAEMYSVLTRAPFIPRVDPAEAGRYLEVSVLPHFQIVTLSADDYRGILSRCATLGIAGGRIFDALHLHSAAIADCDRIYTFNVKHFRLLAPEDLKDKIVMP